MQRFRAAYTGLYDALGRAPALCEIAEALGVRAASAERTRDKLRLAGVEMVWSFARADFGGRREIVRVARFAQEAVA